MYKELLIITDRYWPEGSGGELATYLVLELIRNSFEITVLSGTRNPVRVEGVRYIYEPLLSAGNKHLLWFNASRLARSRAFEKLVERADVVYVPRFAFPVIPLAKRLGKRVIVHLHGYIPVSHTAVVLAPFEEHRHRILRDDLELECMKDFEHCATAALTAWWTPRLAMRWISMADAIICVSKRQAQIISELVPELKDKIKVVYNPPPKVPSIAKKPSEKPTFLYVGGGSYVKGYHLLIKLLRNIANSEKELAKSARFVLTNTYTEKQVEELMYLKRKYGLEIVVKGRVGYEDLLKLHAEAWSLLFPSIWEEPLPYAVMEAMQLGTIPIAAKVGGIPEIVKDTDVEAFVFDPSSIHEFPTKLYNISELSTREIVHLAYRIKDQLSNKFNKNTIKKHLYDIFLA